MSFYATGYLEPTYLLNRANHTGTQTASTVSDFAEAVDDRVAALLVAGANVTLTYDDVANTLTIASGGGGGGGGGSVTSVALSLPSIFSVSGSPITTAGTLTASLASQTQNLVFASPNAASGAPTFRALVSADLPDLSSVYQPLDSDLTSIAALTTTSFGRSLLTQADAAATRSTVGAFNVAGGTLTGTAGAGFVGLPVQSSNPSAPGAGIRFFANSSGIFSWIGTSGFVRSLGGTVTADRIYSFPDTTGTVALLNTLTEIASFTVTGATNTISVSSTGAAQIVNLTLSASVTLTSTPNVQKTSVPTGKKVTLVNTSGSFHLVLTDLGAAGTEEAIVPPNKSIDLIYNGTNWLIISRNDSGLVFVGTNSTTFSLTASFTTSPIGTVTFDPYGKFSSNTWVVPATGYYRCDSKLRIADNATANIYYSQAVHTSNADGTWNQWFFTGPTAVGGTARNGSFNSRTALFNRGDALRMYTYSDPTISAIGLELSITKI